MTFSFAAQPNRLAKEKSPYLLQHAHNPVDWYPWGPEAFTKAKRENKPLLVSIGYSTCHWCHVMERESYEDQDIAKLMNEWFVNIKVDREERPDVDKIYMTAVSAMTGQGGWPLNVFLTPDLKPFFGGTYFPPSARWGQPAWRDVLNQIHETWQSSTDRQKILDAGDYIAKTLKEYAAAAHDPIDPDPSWLEQAYKSLASTYDSDRGGFSRAPKFPMPIYQQFLLRYHHRTGHAKALEMVLLTLGEMSRGGIYDHLGGGFARYSTDARWHIPHFEKMLYDNAQLILNYLELYQATGTMEWARVARETLDYVARDMTHPEGGFYSAEDADSLPEKDSKEKKEGAFYVWKADEIKSLLGEDEAALFNFRFGIRLDGNAALDPHGEFAGANILYVAHSLKECAEHFKTNEADVTRRLDVAKQQLLKIRNNRPRPHLDDKVLTAWNGLMISAFAKGYQVLGDEKYLFTATKATRFLHKNLYDVKGKKLYRRWRDGERKIAGIADDYAFLAQGLVDLYEADFNPHWLEWAGQLLEQLEDRFVDKEKGGFFMTEISDDPHLLVRVKEDADNVEPSASSIAALTYLRLAQYFDHKPWDTLGRNTIRAFGSQLKTQPRAMSAMLAAVDFALAEPPQVVIAGKSDQIETRTLLKILRQTFVPNKTVILSDGSERQNFFTKKLPFLSGVAPIRGKPAAYVCQHHACKTPTTDPATFQDLLTRRKE